MRLQGMGDWVSDLQAAYATTTDWGSPVATQPVTDTTPPPVADSGSGTSILSALSQALASGAPIISQGLNYSLQSQALNKGVSLPTYPTYTNAYGQPVSTQYMVSPATQSSAIVSLLMVGGVAALAFFMLKR